MIQSWIVEVYVAMGISTITSVKLRGNFGNGDRIFYPGQRVVLTVDVVDHGLTKGDEVFIQSLSYPDENKNFIRVEHATTGRVVLISHDQMTEMVENPVPLDDVVRPHDCSELTEPEPKGYGLV